MKYGCIQCHGSNNGIGPRLRLEKGAARDRRYLLNMVENALEGQEHGEYMPLGRRPLTTSEKQEFLEYLKD